MIIYWLLFLFIACFALLEQFDTKKARFRLLLTVFWNAVAVIFVLIMGFRYEVGADWYSYLEHLEFARNNDLFEVIYVQKDPAYATLNWIGANFFGDIYFVNTVCAIIFIWGVFKFCSNQPLRWLALAVATPYLIFVVGMGYTRQGVALALVMASLLFMQAGSVWGFVFFVLIASTFHKVSIILIAFVLFVFTDRVLLMIPLAFLGGFVMFAVFLQESLEMMIDVYIGTEFASSGALTRLIMNAIPAILFLMFRLRFKLFENKYTYNLWMVLSWSAILLLCVLDFSPSSTLIDRLAVYLLPIQIYIFSRLPYVFGGSSRVLSLGIVIGLLVYSAAIQFVWFKFAVNAYAWLPYKSYLTH
ncbi:MAG: EpsG family protein [Magnetococcales bacterium]|nr:EpsG family protein [Magnetococcales bacterium]